MTCVSNQVRFALDDLGLLSRGSWDEGIKVFSEGLAENQVALDIPEVTPPLGPPPVYHIPRLMALLCALSLGAFTDPDTLEVDWPAFEEWIFDARVHQPVAAGAIA